MQEINLTKNSIPHSLNQLFIPASVGFFFNVLFNIVDTYFGGQISPQTLTALSINFPIFFVIIAVVFGFADSYSALIATQIGKGRKDIATKLFFQSLGFGIFLSVLLTIFGILFSKPLLIFLGANGNYLQEALDYILPMFYGSIFLVLTGSLNSGLSAQGNNKINRNFLIGSFVANIFLDYWFIHGGLGLPPLGVTGIALATLLVHVIGVFYFFWHLRKTFLLKTIHWKYFIPQKYYYQQILSQGIPATFNLLNVSVYFFIVNRFLASFGQDTIAAYGIGLRIGQLILVPIIGLGVAIATMVAHNHGANMETRVKKIISVGLFYSLTIAFVGCLFLFFTGKIVMQFFTDSKVIIDIGAQYLQIEAFALFSYSLIHVSAFALQGLKKPSISFLINLVGSISPLPTLFLLITIMQFNTNSVWWALFGNNLVIGIIFIIFLQIILKKSFTTKNEIT